MTNPGSPFPGPIPLDKKTGIYGRAREISELVDRLLADRFVLLYSPSGAGKSSLLEAGVRPRLEDRKIKIRPTMRVNFESTAKTRLNRYTASCLHHLTIPEDAGSTLAEYLPAPAQTELLVFDQFEEILTAGSANDEGERERREFFRQLAELLRVPQRMAVFAIREDYLAPIDPYLDWVPQLLGSRMRINIFTKANAKKAIREPIEATKIVSIDEAAVEILANDLAAGGNWVEPVQMQVVCKRLWLGLKEGTTAIGPDLLKRKDSDFSTEASLKAYYDDIVNRVAVESGEAERTIRDWFEQKLISKSAVRMQAEVGPADTAGLPNKAADALEREHLIRATTGFNNRRTRELTHDRLVQPVIESNRAWRLKNLTDFQREAETWNELRRPPDRLWRGARLRAAERWAKEHDNAVADFEREFLKQSRASANKRLAFALTMAAGLLLAVTAAVVSLRARADSHAFFVQQLAESAAHAVPEEPDAGAYLALAAEHESRDRSLLGKVASLLNGDARTKSNEAAESALLAATMHDPAYIGTIPAGSNLKDEQPVDCVWFEGSQLFAGTGGAAGRSVVNLKERKLNAQPADAAKIPARCSAIAPINKQRVELPPGWQILADPEHFELVSPAGRHIATLVPVPSTDSLRSPRIAVDSAGQWIAWTERGQNYVYAAPITWANNPTFVKSFATGDLEPWAIRFSPDGKFLAGAGRDTAVRIWDLSYDKNHAEKSVETMILRAHSDTVLDLAFSPDGKRLYSAGADHRIVEWQTNANATAAPAETTAFVPGRILIGAMPFQNGAVSVETEKGGRTPGHVDVEIDLLALSPAGNGVITAPDGMPRAFDPAHLAVGPAAKHTHPHDGGAYSLAISADGRTVATANKHGWIFLWQLDGVKEPQRLATWMMDPPAAIASLALTADGKVLATGDEKNHIRFWRPDGTEIDKTRMIPTRQTPKALAFRQGRPWLASIDESANLQLWNVDNRSQIGAAMQFSLRKGSAVPMAFTADGSELQVLTGDGLSSVQSIPLGSDGLHRKVCDAVPPAFDVSLIGALLPDPSFRPDCR